MTAVKAVLVLSAALLNTTCEVGERPSPSARCVPSAKPWSMGDQLRATMTVIKTG